MSRVHNFVLFVPGGVEPFRVPWADECTPDNRNAPRWVRLDHDVVGDGKVMESNLYGLVVDGRDPQDVIDAFCAHDFGRDGEAVMLLRRDGEDDTELYSSLGRSPRLLAAVRGLRS